jgi:uncharacterized membrane protein YkvA (DUF1232 family)
MARRDRATAAASPRRRRAGRQAVLRRTLAALALLPIAGRLPVYGRLVMELLADDRVPRARKGLLIAAAGYAILPSDLIADRIPVLGLLDDLVVGALAVELFLAGVPAVVLDEKLEALGVTRSEFDLDRARVRRAVPLPLRRAVTRIPGAAAAAVRLARSVELGPRLRAWINTMEGSPA